MVINVKSTRLQFQDRLPAAGMQQGQAGADAAVKFSRSKADSWGTVWRGLAKALVVPWQIAKALGKTERRVLMQSNDLSIDTGVSKSEFKKLSARPDGASGQRSAAQDQQVRSIATKLIKAGGETAQLNQVLKECPTDDLVALAKDCASDPTGEFRKQVFDNLRGQLSGLNQAWRDPEMLAKTAHYLDNKAEFDRRIDMQSGPPTPMAEQMQTLKAAVDANMAKPAMAMAKNFFSNTLKAKPSAMFDLPALSAQLLSNQDPDPAKRAAHVQKTLMDNKEALTLLLTFPELERVFQLPAGLAKTLQSTTKLNPAAVFSDKTLGDLRAKFIGPLVDQLREAGASGVPSRQDLGLPVAGKEPKLGLKEGLTQMAQVGLWGTQLIRLTSELSKPEVAAGVTADMDRFVEKFEFRDMMAPIKNMNLEFQGEFKSFIDDVLGGYFDAQSPADKRSMLKSMYSMPPDAMARLAGVLRGSGPYLQKMLQQFGDKIIDPQLRMVLDQLKTGLDPIDETERKALLADILMQPGMGGAQLLEVRSLSAASVAEAVACKIQKAGEDQPREYIIKLLRPGIEQRAGRERQYFEQVAGNYAGVAGTYATVADQIEGELDLRQEAVQVRRGQVYSDAGREGVNAMKLADGFEPQKNVLIIEKAPGQTVKSFIDATKNPALTQEERGQLIEQGRTLASQLAQLGGVWLKEVALGEGFYHGDMHAGNMLTDPQKGLTLIDFGNAGVIEPQEQSRFLMFQAALQRNKPSLVVQALRDLLPPNQRALLQDVWAQVEAQVSALMVKETDGRLKQDLPFAVIDAINKKGIAMPPAFVNLCRAQDMLVQAQASVMARVKDLIAAMPDPQPEACDSGEMDREMDQAVSSSMFDLVKKLGISKSVQLTGFGSRDKLVSVMMKQPQVRQSMQEYEQQLQAHQVSLKAHQEAVKAFESAEAYMEAEEANGNSRIAATGFLYSDYQGEQKDGFPSVDTSLRPALERVLKALDKAELRDLEALAPLFDSLPPLGPQMLEDVRAAEIAFDAINVNRPQAPVAPAPVFVEELYMASVEQAAAAARMLRGQALEEMVRDPAVFPAHLELAVQPSQL